MALAQTLGRNLKQWRQERGLSQEEFAHRSGLHVTYVSGVEHGRRNPTVGVIEKLAIALDVEPEVLLASND